MSEVTTIERLQQQDWQRLKALRLRSVHDSPKAFGTTLEEMNARVDVFWSQQVATMACFAAYTLRPNGKYDIGLVRGTRDAVIAHQAWLLGMWIDPVSRGQGLGLQLCSAVLRWAQQLDGVSCLKLDVSADNRAAIRLYERFGFKQCEGLDERGDQLRYAYAL